MIGSPTKDLQEKYTSSGSPCTRVCVKLALIRASLEESWGRVQVSDCRDTSAVVPTQRRPLKELPKVAWRDGLSLAGGIQCVMPRMSRSHSCQMDVGESETTRPVRRVEPREITSKGFRIRGGWHKHQTFVHLDSVAHRASHTRHLTAQQTPCNVKRAFNRTTNILAANMTHARSQRQPPSQCQMESRRNAIYAGPGASIIHVDIQDAYGLNDKERARMSTEKITKPEIGTREENGERRDSRRRRMFSSFGKCR